MRIVAFGSAASPTLAFRLASRESSDALLKHRPRQSRHDLSLSPLPHRLTNIAAHEPTTHTASGPRAATAEAAPSIARAPWSQRRPAHDPEEEDR